MKRVKTIGADGGVMSLCEKETLSAGKCMFPRLTNSLAVEVISLREMKPFVAAGVFFLLMLLSPLAARAQLWVEAESFSCRGGWKLDHQAFTKIGSAYLNAHGMGVPVEDASTEVEVKEPGMYHLYVNTYNWTSPWYEGKGPGAFQVSVNGKTLLAELGTTGNGWGWQYAGRVRLEAKNRLALHDLTGFNGRVDALYFSKSRRTLPQDREQLRILRNRMMGISEVEKVEGADLVIVGGGVAGCATALTAARYGLKVVLVDNLPRLGGNNYLGVYMSGVMCYNLYPNLGNGVRELSGIPERYHQSYLMERIGNGNGSPIVSLSGDQLADLRERLLREAGVKIYQNVHVFQAEKEGNRVCSVVGKHLITQQEMEFSGSYFLDCTGDGEIGYLLGAEYHIGREDRAFANEPSAPEVADQKKMGGTLDWNSVEMEEASPFYRPEELPWAMPCSSEYYIPVKQFEWTWETGFEIDNALEPELVRDNMLRAIYGNWAYVKTHLPAFAKSKLQRVGHILQKRESRRIMGELVLNENDVRNQVAYPDASFTTTWTLDLHYAQPKNTARFPGWEWQSYCHNSDKSSWIRPYHVPYRVLCAKGFDNLFIGGRNMSVTHMALGTVRVQATLGMAGEVIGMAAKLCHDHHIAPREVYEHYLPQLQEMMRKGIPAKSK